MRRSLVSAAVFGLIAVAGVGDLDAQVPDSVRVDSLAVADSLTAAADSTLPYRPLPPEAVAHLAHVTTAFSDTPGGMGLIHTGIAEAEIAARYVVMAGTDSTSLVAMSRPMASVIHAIDPSQASGGPGLGYGLKRAAAGVETHAALAAAVPGVSQGLLFHTGYVERAARGAALRADEAIALARQIQRAPNAPAAHRLLKELAQAVRAMAWGDDRDRDHRIGHAENEVGLAQAMYHLQLLYRVEGLAPPPPLR